MTMPIIEPGRHLYAGYQHLVPIEELKDEVARQLQAGPRALHDLAGHLGYSEAAVRRRLLELERDQLAFRVAVPAPGVGGRSWLWHHGPAPLVPPKPVQSRPAPRTQAPAGRRMDLVAALFGPARRDEP